LKKYGGDGVYLHVFLTLALRGSWWSSSYLGRFIWKKCCCVHWTERL